MDKLLPKAWEGLLNSSDFLPVIVKTLERIQDAAWSTEPNRHENYEMVYMKRVCRMIYRATRSSLTPTT